MLTWSSVRSVMKHYLSLSQSAHPKNKSFDTLIQDHSNTFMIVKFNVLKELTFKLNAFLVKFQIDSPMITLMSDVSETLLSSLMKRFVLITK